MNKLLIFIFGFGAVGVTGGVAGYVVNDLTSQENPKVMEEIRAEEAQQDEFEDFLEGLAAEPPPSSPQPATDSQPASVPNQGSNTNDND